MKKFQHLRSKHGKENLSSHVDLLRASGISIDFCKICNEPFSQGTGLTQHMKQHSMEPKKSKRKAGKLQQDENLTDEVPLKRPRVDTNDERYVHQASKLIAPKLQVSLDSSKSDMEVDSSASSGIKSEPKPILHGMTRRSESRAAGAQNRPK